MRGGEKVLLELCRLFPKSEIHTLLWESRIGPSGRSSSGSFKLRFFSGCPAPQQDTATICRCFPPLYGSLRIEDADLVLSSSHAVAKGVRVPKAVPHVSYIHTPMRYLWGDSRDYFSFGKGRLWNRVALAVVSPYLRWFDLRSGPIDRPDDRQFRTCAGPGTKGVRPRRAGYLSAGRYGVLLS